MASVDENVAPYILNEEVHELQITCITAIDRYLYLTTITELKLYIDHVVSDAFRSTITTTTTNNVPPVVTSSKQRQKDAKSVSSSPSLSPSLRKRPRHNNSSRERKTQPANIHHSTSSGSEAATKRRSPLPSSPSSTSGQKPATTTTTAPVDFGLQDGTSVILNATQSSFWHLSARSWHHHHQHGGGDAKQQQQQQNTEASSASSAPRGAGGQGKQNHLTITTKDPSSSNSKLQRPNKTSANVASVPMPQQQICESHIVIACNDLGQIYVVLTSLDEKPFLLPLYVLADGTLITFASPAVPPSATASTASASKKERFTATDLVQIDVSPHGSYLAIFHGNSEKVRNNFSTGDSTVKESEKAAVSDTGGNLPTQGFSSPKTNSQQHQRGLVDTPANNNRNVAASSSESAYCVELFENPRGEWTYEFCKFSAHLAVTNSTSNSIAEKCNKIAQQLRAAAMPNTGNAGASTSVLEKRRPLAAGGAMLTVAPVLLFRICSPYSSLVNNAFHDANFASSVGTNPAAATPAVQGADTELHHLHRHPTATGGPRTTNIKSQSSSASPVTNTALDNRTSCGTTVQRVLASLTEPIMMPVATQEAIEKALVREAVCVSNEAIRLYERNCLPTMHFVTRNAVVYANKLSGLQRKAAPQPTGTDSLVMRWTGSCQIQHYAVKLPQPHGILTNKSASTSGDTPHESLRTGEGLSTELTDAEISGGEAIVSSAMTDAVSGNNANNIPGEHSSSSSEERERRQRLQQLIRKPSRCWNYCHTITSSAIGPEAFILAIGLSNGVVVAWNLAQALPIYQILAFSGAIRQLLISTPHGSTHPTSAAETLQFHVLAVGATSSHAPTPAAAENIVNNSNYQQRTNVVVADDALLEPAIKLIDSHGHGNATLRIAMPRDEITDEFALSRLQPLAIGRLGTSRFVVAWDNGLVHTWHHDGSNSGDETWKIEHIDYQPEAFGIAVLRSRRKRQREGLNDIADSSVQHSMIATRHRLYMCNRLVQKTRRAPSAAKSNHRVNIDNNGPIVEYSSVAVLRSRDFLCRSAPVETSKLGWPGQLQPTIPIGSAASNDNTTSGKLVEEGGLSSLSATRLSNLKKLNDSSIRTTTTNETAEFANSAQHVSPCGKKISKPSVEALPVASALMQQQQRQKLDGTTIQSEQEQFETQLPKNNASSTKKPSVNFNDNTFYCGKEAENSAPI